MRRVKKGYCRRGCSRTEAATQIHVWGAARTLLPPRTISRSAINHRSNNILDLCERYL
jgi:hypothetical protein